MQKKVLAVEPLQAAKLQREWGGDFKIPPATKPVCGKNGLAERST